jgi:hypothetical protein
LIFVLELFGLIDDIQCVGAIPLHKKLKKNMNAELLTRLIKSDSALAGFSPDDLPQAAKLRAINTATSLERDFNHKQLVEIAAWSQSSGGFDATASFSSGESSYYVCDDGSLYFASSGDSEVWADAADFAVERIVNGYEGSLDLMDYELLRHLGGYLAEAADERGTQSASQLT